MTTASTLRLPIAACLGVLAFAGCQKPGIRVEIVPKDISLDSRPPGVPGTDQPQLSWTLPAGWEQTKPGQMSIASFMAGDTAVNVTPLPSLAGREEQVVNMWREQVQLGPLSAEEMSKALQPADVAGEKGSFFEILGTRNGKPFRILTAMLNRGNQSWFFKLSGDDTPATLQREAFKEFVKSVRFKEGADSTASAPAPEGGEPAAASNIPAPPSWKVLKPGSMQVAKFAVPDQDGAKAEVSVSVFPSDTGGTLANVNRWRKQLGLAETDEAGLKDCTRALDAAPGAVLIDLMNEQEKRSLLGAIVPRQGQYIFYKMMGDASAVNAARQDFVTFAQAQ